MAKITKPTGHQAGDESRSRSYSITREESMPKALIISDNITMTYAIENEFSLAGWSVETISLSATMERDIASKRDLQCVALVVDKDSRKWTADAIGELDAAIENCSRLSPLYLIFEGDYDSSFSSWLNHTKRMFRLTMHQRNLQNAILEIIRLESEEFAGIIEDSLMSSI